MTVGTFGMIVAPLLVILRRSLPVILRRPLSLSF